MYVKKIACLFSNISTFQPYFKDFTGVAKSCGKKLPGWQKVTGVAENP